MLMKLVRSGCSDSGNLGLRSHPQCAGERERRLMGNPPPLRVDTPSLTWDPAVVTVPPVPTIPPGEDPMSLMISALMPDLAAPLSAAVAATHAREEQFATNLAGARNAYQATDQDSEYEIRTVADSQSARPDQSAGPEPAIPGSIGGQPGQFLSAAMQTASQAPMQLAGMTTAAMQGITQGVQGAVQQLGQLAGQLGKPESEDRPPWEPPEQLPRLADESATAGDSTSELAPVDDHLAAGPSASQRPYDHT